MEITFDPGTIPNAKAWVEQSWWNMARASISALKPAAFLLKNEMRKAVEKNRFNWPALAIYTRSPNSFERPRKTARRWAKGRKTTPWRSGGINIGNVIALRPPGSKSEIGSTVKGMPGQFLWKLKNIFRYLVKEDLMNPRAHIGVMRVFTSKDAQEHFEKFQSGGKLNNFSQAVPSMTKYWGALGMPLSRGKALTQPPRPLIKPLFKALESQVKKKMEDRFLVKLNELTQFTNAAYSEKGMENKANAIRRELASLAARDERSNLK